MEIHFLAKKFGHHSRYSGYDRLLDFIPHAAFTRLPFSQFFPNSYKERHIRDCLAKSNHYGVDELNIELDMLCFFPLGKHLFHFVYAENTFCYSGDFNRKNKLLIGTYHQPESWFRTGNALLAYFSSRVSALDAVIAVSSNQADFLRQYNKNVFCVHHGIDTTFFTPSFENERDPNLCLFVGNWLRDF